ncbi:hypothetical protein O7634_00525 [Micromonospora sp. WMMD1120]|uniref:hypothetical protein n=1 Tax=Micromonospora sp. WMMD1120 TaxID=3016106 RepID=UPI002417A128|nr:hypothetical protein [Micromonospora sp. WMMD1120]MDG4805242.1 hypothetical protein [Micromonospora sp. WMMD1120]
MRRVATTIALLSLSLSALLVPTPASAAATVEVTSAKLVARGVAVDITITVTCESSQNGGAEFSLRQRADDHVAYGSGWSAVHCTGAPQAVTGRVYAEAGGYAFNRGIALVNGGIELCTEIDCDYSTRFDGEIRITR